MLPKLWVDEIFKRLTVRYGTGFLARWTSAGVDLKDVQDDWAKQLSGMPADAIGFALNHLGEKAPTVSEFRALCNLMPAPEVKLLPEPKADPARVASLMEKIHHHIDNRSPAAQVVDRLFEIHDKRGLAPVQKDFIKSCLKVISDGHRHERAAQIGIGA